MILELLSKHVFGASSKGSPSLTMQFMVYSTKFKEFYSSEIYKTYEFNDNWVSWDF